MDIKITHQSQQTALIKVVIEKADTAEKVEKKLREYRAKANIPGFRKGMVPMGMIRKMYERDTTAETAYREASDGCFKYIETEKIDYMGDVLPSEEQGQLDFENGTSWEFVFEIGIAPKVDFELTEKDKITKYSIKIDKEMRTSTKENFLRRYGHLDDVDKVSDDEAIMGVLDNGTITKEDAYIGLVSMTPEERKAYKGKKVGDSFVVNITELYKNASQRASMLGVKQDELDTIAPEFTFTITKIRRFAMPEMNEEFFKTAFPQGEVTDEAGLDTFIDSRIESDLENESKALLNEELRRYLIDKANVTLPEAFLRKWLVLVNEGKFTEEQIDADFAGFLNMMRWSVVQKYLVTKYDVKVDNEQIFESAREVARSQFAQYGMMNVDEETLSGYATQLLQDKRQANSIIDRCYETKTIEAILPLIKVASKAVSQDDFLKHAKSLQ